MPCSFFGGQEGNFSLSIKSISAVRKCSENKQLFVSEKDDVHPGDLEKGVQPRDIEARVRIFPGRLGTVSNIMCNKGCQFPSYASDAVTLKGDVRHPGCATGHLGAIPRHDPLWLPWSDPRSLNSSIAGLGSRSIPNHKQCSVAGIQQHVQIGSAEVDQEVRAISTNQYLRAGSDRRPREGFTSDLHMARVTKESEKSTG